MSKSTTIVDQLLAASRHRARRARKNATRIDCTRRAVDEDVAVALGHIEAISAHLRTAKPGRKSERRLGLAQDVLAELRAAHLALEEG
jgi:hypothetical protein